MGIYNLDLNLNNSHDDLYHHPHPHRLRDWSRYWFPYTHPYLKYINYYSIRSKSTSSPPLGDSSIIMDNDRIFSSSSMIRSIFIIIMEDIGFDIIGIFWFYRRYLFLIFLSSRFFWLFLIRSWGSFDNLSYFLDGSPDIPMIVYSDSKIDYDYYRSILIKLK